MGRGAGEPFASTRSVALGRDGKMPWKRWEVTEVTSCNRLKETVNIPLDGFKGYHVLRDIYMIIAYRMVLYIYILEYYVIDYVILFD